MLCNCDKNNNMCMLKIKNLRKTYESKKKAQIQALRGVSLSFSEKGLVFILGKSGSGKSTLLNLLGGLDRPTSGEVIVAGRSSNNFSEKDFDAYRNNYVGFVFQEFNLIDNYTVGDNVALALALQRKKTSKKDVDPILKELELTDDKGDTLYDRRINELSGGQKQRVAIARALIKDPKIILADEPTGALDNETGIELYELLKKLSSNKLVIIVSHNIEAAKKYADRIIVLQDGTVISDTSCRENEKKPRAVYDCCKTSPGRLPFFYMLSMGVAGLKCKPFRLVVSIILAVVAFTFFCFSTVSTTTDVMAAELKTAYKNKEKTAMIVADSIGKSYTKYSDGYTLKRTFECTPSLTKEQIEKLFETNDFVVMKTVAPWALPSGFGKNNLGKVSQAETYNPYNYLSNDGFKRVVEISPESGETDACLKPDSRLTVECRLPENFREIAITDYWADMYMRFGFVDEDGSTHKIDCPDDLIGRSLDGEFSICGIYSTYEDREWLKKYDYNEYNYEYVTNDYISRWLNGEHIMSYAFVCDGYNDNVAPEFSDKEWNPIYGVLYKLSGSISKDKKLIKKISYTYYEEWLPEQNLGTYTRVDYFISARFNTSYTGFSEATKFLRSEIFLTFAMIVSICFAVFSALLLLGFLFVNIEERKRELGIIRALGGRAIDVAKICMTESLVIACIDFVLVLIITNAICVVLNIKYNLWLFCIGVIPLLLLALLCLVVTTLSTVMPIIYLAKKKPIDIINNK